MVHDGKFTVSLGIQRLCTRFGWMQVYSFATRRSWLLHIVYKRMQNWFYRLCDAYGNELMYHLSIERFNYIYWFLLFHMFVKFISIVQIEIYVVLKFFAVAKYNKYSYLNKKKYKVLMAIQIIGTKKYVPTETKTPSVAIICFSRLSTPITKWYLKRERFQNQSRCAGWNARV